MWSEESLNLTNPTNKIIGGLNEQSYQNRSRIGFCRSCQWQSSCRHQPSSQDAISTQSGIEGLQLAKGDDSAWQIVSQSQDFSVGFLEQSLIRSATAFHQSPQRRMTSLPQRRSYAPP